MSKWCHFKGLAGRKPFGRYAAASGPKLEALVTLTSRKTGIGFH
jgi:hypothetical protein